MKKILDNPIFILTARLILGFLFVIVAIGKIYEPGAFANEISNYNILPQQLVNISALILPWLELIIGILLISGVRVKANSIIAAILLIAFIAAVASAMARGLDINCGCYSNIKAEAVGWPKILENTGLLILSILILISKSSGLALENFAKSKGRVSE